MVNYSFEKSLDQNAYAI